MRFLPALRCSIINAQAPLYSYFILLVPSAVKLYPFVLASKGSSALQEFVAVCFCFKANIFPGFKKSLHGKV